jgi:thiosulfate/3-mercaptopyruvate sulfurtransferase
MTDGARDPGGAGDAGGRDEASDAGDPDEASDAGDPDEASDAGDPDEAGDAGDPDEASDAGDPDEAGARSLPWVVDADWLAAHLDDPDVVVVDVRDAWEYDGIGHVPDAVNVPFDSFRSEGDDDVGMLPGAEAWARVMADAGIDPTDRVVAYDDTHGVFAARFLVTAMMYGHRDVALLDGDYAAYTRSHPTTTDAPAVEASEYPATVPSDRPLIDADAVAALLDAGSDDDADADRNVETESDGGVVFVDTRDDWEFAERHLPGAVNLDWKALVDDETRGLLPEPDLREVLAAHGITPGKRVVLYCNTARRISHTYVVLKHLGYDRVDFYEGSLREWRARDGALDTVD